MLCEKPLKLRAILPNKSSAILIFDNVNRYYFGGFKSSAGALLITRERAIHLLDGRYFNATESEKSAEIEFVLLKDLQKQLTNFVNDFKISKIFVEPTISVERLEILKKALKNAEIKPFAKLKSTIINQRLIKSDFEIGCIKSAQNIADKTFEQILSVIKPGVTEFEVAAEIDYTMKKMGSEKSAFETIVAAGKNSAIPHHHASCYKLKTGDAILMDFGATCKNYRSDMTRTVFLGKPSDEQKRAYNAVLAAQKSAIEVLKSGILARKVDFAAREFLKSQNLEKYFLHGTGHGVGLNIHEEPFLGKSCKEKLKSGMVITIEPGVYIKNKFGIRIEDMLKITDTGAENLTKSPKDLITL